MQNFVWLLGPKNDFKRIIGFCCERLTVVRVSGDQKAISVIAGEGNLRNLNERGESLNLEMHKTVSRRSRRRQEQRPKMMGGRKRTGGQAVRDPFVTKMVTDSLLRIAPLKEWRQTQKPRKGSQQAKSEP